MPKSPDPERQLAGFMAKFTPQVAELAEAILNKMRNRYPTALELVYDNYNALAIGFCPTERASDGIFSIALYPKWVSIFFLQGARLPDPAGILKGSGNVVRYIVLPNPAMLDDPVVTALMSEAVARARVPFNPKGAHRLIIKAVSAKQRARTPATATAKHKAGKKTVA
ncbi:MAG: hypothetical protein WAL75_19145 [Terracidiphilus sp.]